MVLLVEIGFVASMVTWVGFLTRGASLTVAAVLALVLITLYHSGREVTRQGLPHFGRIVRDMAIPVAIMATVAEFYAPGRGVIQDSIQMVAVGTASAVLATLIRRQLSGRVRIVVVAAAAAIAQSATMWAGSKRVEIVGALRLPVADEDLDSPVELFGVPVFQGVESLAEQVSTHHAELVVVLSGPSVDSALMRRLSWSLEDSEASLALLSVLDCVAPHRKPRKLGERNRPLVIEATRRMAFTQERCGGRDCLRTRGVEPKQIDFLSGHRGRTADNGEISPAYG